MTRDDIIRMAGEAGAGAHEGYELLYHTFSPVALTRFAGLVAAAEREACAKECEELIARKFQKPLSFDMIAAAIRARGAT